MSRYLFTSESVTEGHPDKICDAISDAVLDSALAGDPRSRVACETLCKTGFVVVAGEITTQSKIDFGRVAREVIKEIGYDHSSMGFDYETCGVLTAIEPQSPDISQGVTEGEGLFKEQGAGDQGLMFGYACDETPELMPAPIMYAHALTRQLAAVRKANKVDFLRPDGKSQVTLEYEDGKPTRIETVVVSTQHSPDVKYKQLKESVMELVVKKSLPAELLDNKTKYFINPTGRFVIGGPFGDAGLTGRKIIVDSYGGMGRHGGGAFSGKDPSKVDRSACYYARYVAKNIVASGAASRCEVQVAYAIGVAQPMGVYVHTFGTGKVDDEKLAAYVMKNFDMRPRALIEELDLLRPIYRATAAYGHFGRSEFSWEKTDRAEQIASELLGGQAAKSNGVKANGKASRSSSKPGKEAPSGRERGGRASKDKDVELEASKDVEVSSGRGGRGKGREAASAGKESRSASRETVAPASGKAGRGKGSRVTAAPAPAREARGKSASAGKEGRARSANGAAAKGAGGKGSAKERGGRSSRSGRGRASAEA